MTSELRTRSITAVGIGAVIIGSLVASEISAALLMLLIYWFCAYECIGLHNGMKRTTMRIIFATMAMLPTIWSLYSIFTASDEATATLTSIHMWMLPVLFLIYGVLVLLTQEDNHYDSLTAMAFTLVLFTAGSMFALDIVQRSPLLILGVFILIWTNDSFAYLVGKKIGKTRLAPKISPGKTWEGVAGGAVFCLAAGALLSIWLHEISLTQWMITALIVVVFGTAGDLIQSVYKRKYGAKDSGNVLPGHGGFWDRFDSFAGSIPIIAIYLMQTGS